jgi:sarcosine oxidase delta subunit
MGCRRFIKVERHTETNEVRSATAAGVAEVPGTGAGMTEIPDAEIPAGGPAR